MKIILAALNAKYVHSNLAVYNLEAYAEKQFYSEYGLNPEIIIKEYTINHNLDLILQSLYQEKADVVAFSCYIWNIYEIKTIARELKKVEPYIRIWLGGPEVSYESEQFLVENDVVEGIMQGEGEVTFYELAKVWHNIYGEMQTDITADVENHIAGMTQQEEAEYADNLYKGIKGIVYRDRNGVIHTNTMRPFMPLDEVPFIYEDLSLFKNKILYYETSRGCPFSCSYCLSSIDKSVRFRSLSLVKEELQFFLNHNVPQVKFIDRTFNCNREHALAIWHYITEHDNGVTNFHFEVSADLISEEELNLFAKMRPGLIQLEIGLQSANQPTIKEIRRKMNVDRLKQVMLKIHGFGNIHQHLDLIAGLPYEDFDTFKESFNTAYEMMPNQLQLGFLKVLKGSYMSVQRDIYELKYQSHQPYEVLSTKWISYDNILALKKVEEMVEVYYNSDQFEHILPYIISFFDTPFSFYEALGEYYAKHQLYGIGFKREARYMALLGFCDEWFGRPPKNTGGDFKLSTGVLYSLLCFDYYLRENAKSRPVWSKEEPIEKNVYQTFFKQCGTEEVNLDYAGYDSKAAARMMHIEPVCGEAIPWILEDVELGEGICYRDLINQKVCYCLFDYQNRNLLSKGAYVTLLSGL